MTATFQSPNRANIVLEGDQLLDFVNTNSTTLSNTQMREQCGYHSQESFIEALTAARLFRGEYTDAHGCPTHDVYLLEHLEQTLCVTQTECVDIAVTLRDDYGITDLQGYQDLFAYQSEEYNWESEFAEYWATEVCCLDTNLTQDAGNFSWIVIDWQATWDCNLRYDFSTIEYSDGVIILHNN
jgi:hypothetical protein